MTSCEMDFQKSKDRPLKNRNQSRRQDHHHIICSIVIRRNETCLNLEVKKQAFAPEKESHKEEGQPQRKMELPAGRGGTRAASITKTTKNEKATQKPKKGVWATRPNLWRIQISRRQQQTEERKVISQGKNMSDQRQFNNSAEKSQRRVSCLQISGMPL